MIYTWKEVPFLNRYPFLEVRSLAGRFQPQTPTDLFVVNCFLFQYPDYGVSFMVVQEVETLAAGLGREVINDPAHINIAVSCNPDVKIIGLDDLFSGIHLILIDVEHERLDIIFPEITDPCGINV